MSTCAAVIVTYYPSSDSLINLENISSKCDHIVVIDNTPFNEPVNFPKISNLTVQKTGWNIGLAAALNKGIELAIEKHAEHIFLFDQDSRPPDKFMQEMLNFKARHSKNNPEAAFYVPDFFDRNSNTFAKFPCLSRFTVLFFRCKKAHSLENEKALLAITSGTLITPSMYKRIGPFKNDYFIDSLDHEYCLRVYQKGMRIAVNCNTTLNHAIGKRSLHSLLGVTIKANHHSAFRRYYMSRNGIRTAIDYFRMFPAFFYFIVARIIHEFLSVLAFESGKKKKLVMILTGALHGILGIQGEMTGDKHSSSFFRAP